MAYLQKAWTDPIDNPSLSDVQMALTEVQKMDGEHGAFWMGTDEEDIVLEVQRDMKMTLILSGEICRESKCASWKQAEELYRRFVNGEYDKVKEEFECL